MTSLLPAAMFPPHLVHLRILETTDLHVQVYPLDYYTNRRHNGIGLAQAATLVASMRQGAANSLLFDNGDFLQGSPLGDYIAYARGMAPGQTHPIVDAMNKLGYDGGTLGNHEFNYGLDFLLNALAGARFPLVSANISLREGAGPRRDHPLVPPYMLLDRVLTDGHGLAHPIRIGVIGFLPPQVTVWDYKYLHNRAFTRDIVQSARQWLPEMKEAGADIIIALSHSGIGPEHHREGSENASLALSALPQIDVVLAGHSHQVFPAPDIAATPGVNKVQGTFFGKPAVMAGAWGSHVGQVDLALERTGGQWRIVQAQTAALRVATAFQMTGAPKPGAPKPGGGLRRGPVADPRILRATRTAHRETLDYMRRLVGFSPVPIHSYFSLISDGPAVRIVAEAQRAHVQAALAGTSHAGLPVLSAAAPFKAGGRAGATNYTDIAAGPLMLRNVADLYIYPNMIRALRLTGAELALWLERAAGLYHQLVPGKTDQMLLNPDFPSYNFDMIYGLSYAMDLSQPARFTPEGALANPQATRIRDLCHGGVPVDPHAEFILATNDYRAHGGGDFPGATSGHVVMEGTETNRNLVLNFITRQEQPGFAPAETWRLMPAPGTSALFDTGPAALAHQADVTTLRIEPAGDGAQGFTRFRVHL